ncbi:hypothetical protein YC2023_074898 [Brassica napus]
MEIKSTWPERKRERSKVVNLECSRFSPRRPVPSNRRFYTIVTRKLFPNDFVQTKLVQFHGFRSDEVLLDTPPGSPKNCLAAKGGSVQISPSRPVSVFIIKPRVYLSRDQFSPVQSRRSSWVLAKSSPINQLLLA